MNRMTIVPANEFFKLDALAVFRDLASAILFHARNLGEFRSTHNLVFGPTRCGPLPDASRGATVSSLNSMNCRLPN
jgi:hypothetical protein